MKVKIINQKTIKIKINQMIKRKTHLKIKLPLLIPSLNILTQLLLGFLTILESKLMEQYYSPLHTKETSYFLVYLVMG